MPKRVLTGVVTSNKCDKTLTVKVARRVMHPIYKKYINRSKKYHVHDSENKGVVGKTVSFIESKPLSKTKRWTLLEADNA